MKVITALRYEILTAVLMNIQVFWDVTLCRMVNSYKCFNEAYCLHLQRLTVHKEY
jgi:hypothetical protein